MKKFSDARGAAHIIGIVGIVVVLAVSFVGYKLYNASHADAIGSPIVGTASKCLDMSGNKLVAGTKIQLWSCNGSSAQSWVYKDSTIQNRGFCIGVLNNSTVEETSLVLQTCDKSAGQTWTYRADKTLLNPATNFCMNDAKNKSDNGTVININRCNNTSAQFWSVQVTTATAPPIKTDTPTNGAAADNITFATWNTRYSNTSDNLGTSVKTLTPAAQVIGLQEIHKSSKRKDVRDKLLCASCAYSSQVTDFNIDSSSASSLMILWDRSRLTQVGNAGSIHVSGDVNVNDSAGDSVSDKYIVWVRLKENSSGRQFYFMNTHTVASVEASGKPNSDNDKRLALYKTHMDKLVAQIKVLQADNIPIFLGGDFNVNYRYDSKVQNSMFPYVRLGAVNMKSNYQWLNLGGIASDQQTSSGNNRLIDYVWAWNRSDTSLTSENINSATLGSDHHPVFVSATLKSNP